MSKTKDDEAFDKVKGSINLTKNKANIFEKTFMQDDSAFNQIEMDELIKDFQKNLKLMSESD